MLYCLLCILHFIIKIISIWIHQIIGVNDWLTSYGRMEKYNSILLQWMNDNGSFLWHGYNAECGKSATGILRNKPNTNPKANPNPNTNPNSNPNTNFVPHHHSAKYQSHIFRIPHFTTARFLSLLAGTEFNYACYVFLTEQRNLAKAEWQTTTATEWWKPGITYLLTRCIRFTRPVGNTERHRNLPKINW